MAEEDLPTASVLMYGKVRIGVRNQAEAAKVPGSDLQAKLCM